MGLEDTMSEQITLHCNFCGNSHFEVKRLMAGPKGHVCDACIETMYEGTESLRLSNNALLVAISASDDPRMCCLCQDADRSSDGKWDVFENGDATSVVCKECVTTTWQIFNSDHQSNKSDEFDPSFVDRFIDNHLRTISPDTSAVEFVVPDSEERMYINYISGDDSHGISVTDSFLFFEVLHRLMSRREEGYSPGKGHLMVKADRERIIAYDLTISHRRILLTCSSDDNR